MIRTRLTERFGLAAPVIGAPMALVAGGRLAAAVSNAGGLGLIGGGYAGRLGGEPDPNEQWREAGNASVGIGFIAWALAEASADVLTEALARKPKAVFLSFPRAPDDLRAPVLVAHGAGVPVIVQVQSMEGARAALDLGVAAVVAQGTEAGGHGGARATMPFVPEVADLVAALAPETLVLAAGGIADGRGLAAALMLGADGAVVGSRLWAAAEALTPPAHVERAVVSDGDATVRTGDVDRARGLDWPAPYSFRVVRNAFTDALEPDPEFGSQAARYDAARAAGDVDVMPAVAGEAVGLIHAREPAGEIVERMVAEAEARLRGGIDLVG